MEIFRTDDQTVTKFIHADGSETAIKCVPSQSTFVDVESGTVDTQYSDRNKYSIFISASTGCYLKCPQCWLTLKDSMYRKLQAEQVLANLKEAITAEIAVRPELADRYVKLCWMGMGDALNQPQMVRHVTLALLDWIMARGYARGLDSVDLSSVGPSVRPDWVRWFAALDDELKAFPHNPQSANVEQAEQASFSQYRDRSTFRLFYSLHSAIQASRDRIAPGTASLETIKPLLHQVQAAGISLVFHQLFVEGLNTGMHEVDAILDFLEEFPGSELRVLRYNTCDRSPYREWTEIEQALQALAQRHPMLKVQISAGSEVQAACGQFLVAAPRSRAKDFTVYETPHQPVSLVRI